jgi:hypothetical protein
VCMPPSIEAWVQALQSVNTDPQRINGKQLKGYAFPDPGLFISTISTTKREVYLATWLSSRAAWMCGMSKQLWPEGGCPTRVPAQLWRDFLRRGCFPETADSISSTPSQTHQADTCPATSRRTKAQRRNQEVTKIFRDHTGEDLKDVDGVYWRGQRLSKDDFTHLEPGVLSEILWDLYEHNWRFDLLTLDRVVNPSLWRGEEAHNRDVLIKSLFHNQSYLITEFPQSNVGISASLWKDRSPYISILRQILSSWPSWPHLPHSVRERKLVTLEDANIVERGLADIYCQTFFDIFGRAPVTPHRFPFRTPVTLHRFPFRPPA